MASYGVTERGQMKLFYEGRGHVKKYQKKCGGQVWRCTERGCQGRVETTEGCESVKVNSEHTCGRPSDPNSPKEDPGHGAGSSGMANPVEGTAKKVENPEFPTVSGTQKESEPSQQLGKKKALDQELDRHLVNWINSYGDNQHLISRKMVQAEARKFSKREDFKASRNWLDAFLRRNRNLIGKRIQASRKKSGPLSADAKPINQVLYCINCCHVLRNANDYVEEIPCVDTTLLKESELGLAPNFTSKIRVKEALSPIYGLKYLEKMYVMEGECLKSPRQNFRLCLRCASVLADMYKLYMEFNLLRKAGSYLEKQNKELERLVDNYARSNADLTDPNFHVRPRTAFEEEQKPEDAFCNSDFKPGFTNEPLPTFTLVEQAVRSTESTAFSAVPSGESVAQEEDIKFDPNIPTDVSVFPEISSSILEDWPTVNEVVLSPPPQFKDDPEKEAGASPFSSAMKGHCCSYLNANDEPWESSDPFRRKREAEFAVSHVEPELKILRMESDTELGGDSSSEPSIDEPLFEAEANDPLALDDEDMVLPD